MKRSIRIVVASALTFGALNASAHQPKLANQSVTIDKPKVSHALYGELSGPDDVRTIRLSYDEPFALPFEILVPTKGVQKKHRPAYAVVGPGLPAPTDEERAYLPRDVADGLGVYVERNEADERPVIFESFTRRAFWTSTPIALRLPGGDYEVWVWSPRGTDGEFAMGFGVEEDFSDGFGGVFADWGDYAY